MDLKWRIQTGSCSAFCCAEAPVRPVREDEFPVFTARNNHPDTMRNPATAHETLAVMEGGEGFVPCERNEATHLVVVKTAAWQDYRTYSLKTA